ncbi:MAG: hypothetical protein NVSMB51_17410 [Solirubrobacteraceae bacterium]
MGGKPLGLRPVLTAAGFALVCFCLTLYVWIAFGGSVPLQAHGYRINASFDQAANLADHEDVRIAGVTVGKVVRVTPSAGLTHAELELYPQYAPLPADAHAILRAKTLLGENFVALTPGSSSAPKLPENGWLAASNVQATQQVDQVLGAFDERTRSALKQFLKETTTALHGRGADLNAAIGQAPPTLDQLNQLVGILEQQGTSVQGLIRDSGAALRTVAGRGADLHTMIAAGNQVFAATAARSRELTAAIDSLPPFLAQLRTTLRVVRATALDAAPTLHALRPVAPLVRPALHSLNRLAPQLTKVFQELPATSSAALTGLPALTRVLLEAAPLASALDGAGRQLVPVVQLLELYPDSVASLVNLTAATEAVTPLPGGGSQHYLRASLPIVNELNLGYSQRLPSNRHNPYPVPGNQKTDALQAFDCRNLSNPLTAPIIGTGAPPCVTQTPLQFQGAARAYTDVAPFSP